MKYLDTINTALTYAPMVGGAALLAFTYIQHLRDKLTPQVLKKCVWFAALFFGIVIIGEIIAQYYTYKADPAIGSHLLPPYQKIGWFALHSWYWYVAPYVLSFAAGLFMYGVALSTNKSFKRELFVENDKYVFLLAALILSWPNYALYLTFAAILVAIQTIVVTVMKNDFGERVVLTHALLLSIAGVLIFGKIVAARIGLWILTI